MTEGEVSTAARLREREDFLAYLLRKRANAAVLAKRTPESNEEWSIYQDRVRQIDIVSEEITQGRHVDEAEVQAMIAEALARDASAAV